MEIDRAIAADRHNQFAYSFELWEEQLIAKCLQPEIKKMQKKIESIRNNPRNEGQAKYILQIDQLDSRIKSVEKIIANLK